MECFFDNARGINRRTLSVISSNPEREGIMITNGRRVKRPETSLHKVMRGLYNYRSWWVDFPTLSLLALYYWDFFSKHAHPIPTEMPETCWIILGMYILIKEGVRWKLHDIQSRKGSLLVALWLLSMLIFFFVRAWQPNNGYEMPSQMVETTIVVLGGFLGVLPIKWAFFRKFKKAAGYLEEPK